MNTKNIVIAIVAALVVGAGAWFIFSSGGGGEGGAVALVNGEEVSRADFNAIQEQARAGQDPAAGALDPEAESQLNLQIVNSLVSQTLLRQAVERSGVTAEEAEVESQIDEIKNQLGGEEAFAQALAAEEMTAEELRSQVGADLATQAYLEQELSLSSISATDAEIAAAYERVPTEDGVPSLEDVRDRLEELVVEEKQQDLILRFVDELRAEAEIEILI